MLALPLFGLGGLLVYTGATGTLAAVLAAIFSPSELIEKPGNSVVDSALSKALAGAADVIDPLAPWNW